MLNRVRERLTYANVIATCALFVALGGGAYALEGRNTVDAGDLKKNAVKPPEIAKNAVKKAETAKNSVGTGEVIDGSLLDQDFAPGQLPAGPQGERGPHGLTGKQGPPGPTEGMSTDTQTATAFAPDSLLDSSSISTTIEGHLLVVKTMSALASGCVSGSPWRIWATVDGVRVPGTLMVDIPAGTQLRNITLTGVTEDVVPAGSHEVALAVDCQNHNTAFPEFTAVEDATLVVLG